jgi:putative transposase
MSIKLKVEESNGVYFITFTCIKWIPLFAITNGYSLVYDWYRYLQREGHFIVSYVIMPNHIHSVIAFRASHKTVNYYIANGKRFIAYGLIKKLKELNQNKLLHQLSTYVTRSEQLRNKKHEVFEPSFDHKDCRSIYFLQQKVGYIHLNPFKAGLVELPEQYKHSSANYYINGVRGEVNVVTYMELQDIDLSIRL